MPHSDPLGPLYRDSLVHNPARFDSATRAALLCIDLQHLDTARGAGMLQEHSEQLEDYYFRQLYGTVLPNVARLQQAFRVAGQEVIHVRIQSLTQDGRDRGPTHKRLGLLATPGSRDAEFVHEVRPVGDEIVINKTASGVFSSTNLEYVLRNLGITLLVAVGVFTDECVSTTVRVASDLGFYVTLVHDACTTVTPELHRYTVATLEHRYARVVGTDTAIAEIRASPQKSTPAPSKMSSSGDPPPFVSRPRPRSVVLLGGSALAPADGELTMADQFALAKQAARRLVPLFQTHREVVLVHGNGPQVGQMLTRVEESLGKAYAIPLGVCVAESEGELGYILQQALQNALREQDIDRSVASVLTQTIVDPDDPAFHNPTKPIGPYYDAERAHELSARDFTLRKGARGFRRLVPSPQPLEILELGVLRGLLQMGVIVVAAGGGGVPVTRTESGALVGVDAVLDKDLTGSLLARSLGADELVIVTSVPQVYLNYGSDSQTALDRTCPSQLRNLLKQGHFEAGTMAPKIQASVHFVETTGGSTIICDVASLPAALEGRAGTWVIPDADAGPHAT